MVYARRILCPRVLDDGFLKYIQIDLFKDIFGFLMTQYLEWGNKCNLAGSCFNHCFNVSSSIYGIQFEQFDLFIENYNHLISRVLITLQLHKSCSSCSYNISNISLFTRQP